MTSGPAFPPEWAIGAAETLADTRSSRVWKVERIGHPGAAFVVKALKPAGMEELRGAHYLRWRDGHGTARLHDLQGATMLLEYAGDHSLDAHLKDGRDGECVEIFAQALAALHAPSPTPVPADLQPLERHFSALFAAAGKKPLYAQGARTAERLLAMPHGAVPLHGDLHHGNVLESPRGWLAIDPHGLLGDAAFDAGNIFYNPYDRDELCLDPARARRMAERFALAMGCRPAHVLDHAFAYGCLSAAWHGEDGDGQNEARVLRIAAMLKALREADYPA